MACTALIDALDQPIKLEPLAKFPVVRDLAVDRGTMFEAAEARQGVGPDRRHLRPRARTAHGRESSARSPTSFSQCITCGNCLEVCPQVNDRSNFIGAAPIAQVAPLQPPSDREHERGRAARGADGRWGRRRLRQRAELRARLPEVHSADDRRSPRCSAPATVHGFEEALRNLRRVRVVSTQLTEPELITDD